MSRRANSPRGSQGGFTLLEVMIAIVIMAIGLLGFAMLQTMNVRFTKSAQQRTVASNMAYELVDMMRTQRRVSGAYSSITYASFSSEPDVSLAGCEELAAATTAANIARWRCNVHNALPNGAGNVAFLGDGRIVVGVRWTDAPWAAGGATENGVASDETQFEVATTL